MRYWRLAAALTVGCLALGIILLWTGTLPEVYQWIWQHSTGRPYTHIMRDAPSLLIIPSLLVISLSARFLPRTFWGRIVLIDLVFIIGLIFGHVFWSG